MKVNRDNESRNHTVKGKVEVLAIPANEELAFTISRQRILLPK
ncbi:hypothetical protein [Glaciecola sp. SC05]